MKRLFALILLVALCCGLCACDSVNSLSAKERSIVGEWEGSSEDSYYRSRSLVLLASGRFADISPNNIAGTWEVHDGMLYLFMGNYFERYKISGDKLVDASGDVAFTKE